MRPPSSRSTGRGHLRLPAGARGSLTRRPHRPPGGPVPRAWQPAGQPAAKADHQVRDLDRTPASRPGARGIRPPPVPGSPLPGSRRRSGIPAPGTPVPTTPRDPEPTAARRRSRFAQRWHPLPPRCPATSARARPGAARRVSAGTPAPVGSGSQTSVDTPRPGAGSAGPEQRGTPRRSGPGSLPGPGPPRRARAGTATSPPEGHGNWGRAAPPSRVRREPCPASALRSATHRAAPRGPARTRDEPAAHVSRETPPLRRGRRRSPASPAHLDHHRPFIDVRPVEGWRLPAAAPTLSRPATTRVVAPGPPAGGSTALPWRWQPNPRTGLDGRAVPAGTRRRGVTSCDATHRVGDPPPRHRPERPELRATADRTPPAAARAGPAARLLVTHRHTVNRRSPGGGTGPDASPPHGRPRSRVRPARDRVRLRAAAVSRVPRETSPRGNGGTRGNGTRPFGGPRELAHRMPPHGQTGCHRRASADDSAPPMETVVAGSQALDEGRPARCGDSTTGRVLITVPAPCRPPPTRPTPAIACGFHRPAVVSPWPLGTAERRHSALGVAMTNRPEAGPEVGPENRPPPPAMVAAERPARHRRARARGRTVSRVRCGRPGVRAPGRPHPASQRHPARALMTGRAGVTAATHRASPASEARARFRWSGRGTAGAAPGAGAELPNRASRRGPEHPSHRTRADATRPASRTWRGRRGPWSGTHHRVGGSAARRDPAPEAGPAHPPPSYHRSSETRPAPCPLSRRRGRPGLIADEFRCSARPRASTAEEEPRPDRVPAASLHRHCQDEREGPVGTATPVGPIPGGQEPQARTGRRTGRRPRR